MPPEWMWLFDDELEAWFEEVELIRQNKYSGRDSAPPGSEMVENEFYKAKRRRR